MVILLYLDSLGREHAVAVGSRPVVVGRESGCDVVLADPLVSRKHCTVAERDGGVQVTDLGSRYGTWLDDQRVEGVRAGAVGSAAVVRVGGTVLRLIERSEQQIAGDAGAAGVMATGPAPASRQPSSSGSTKSLDIALSEAKRLALRMVATASPDGYDLASEVLDAISAAQSAAAALELDRGLSLMLVEVSKVTASANDVESVLRLTMDLALRAIGGERGFILLRGDGDELVTRINRNMGDLRGISHSIAGEVVRTGEPVRTTDAQVDPRFKEAASVMANIVRSVLCVPLRSGSGSGRTIGAIYVDGMPGNPMFGDKGLEFLNAFSAHAASAIEASTGPRIAVVGGRR